MHHRTATDAWIANLRSVMQGSLVRPRGKATRELLGFSSSFPMDYPIVTTPERNLGYRFMAAEAAWILSGDNRVRTIAPYSKAISQFSDDGIEFFGAYGPRVLDQLEYVIETLRQDPDSRQAVMSIWRNNPPKTKDVPCTVAIQWLIRDGKLHCFDTMRSSDLWLGWPYDVVNFTMISAYIAITLKIPLGNLTLTAGSQHVYERDWEAVEKILSNDQTFSFRNKFNPAVFESGRHLVVSLWASARNGGLLEEGLVPSWDE